MKISIIVLCIHFVGLLALGSEAVKMDRPQDIMAQVESCGSHISAINRFHALSDDILRLKNLILSRNSATSDAKINEINRKIMIETKSLNTKSNQLFVAIHCLNDRGLGTRLDNVKIEEYILNQTELELNKLSFESAFYSDQDKEASYAIGFAEVSKRVFAESLGKALSL